MAKRNSKLREKKGIVELKVGKSIFIGICFAVFSIFFLISQITFEPTALHSAGSLNEVKEEHIEYLNNHYRPYNDLLNDFVGEEIF